MKIAAIIQARMGSTRIPGKTLAPIEGYPMLWHLLQRVRASTYIQQVILATTQSPQDALLVDFAKNQGLAVTLGEEQDVLDRVYQAAVLHNVETIVRITPDCPLHDPSVMDLVISEYLKGGCDYASNTVTYTFPEGLDVEVFSIEALKRTWEEAPKSSEREHVTPYIRNHPELFRIQEVRGPFQYGSFHWSVDEPADLEFVRAIYRNLYREGSIFSMQDVLNLLTKLPELSSINENVTINAGYSKSIEQEAMIGREMSFKKSFEWLARAEQVIPGASQTFSKGWTQYSRGVNPVFVEKGLGCILTDPDGNQFIDYSMALCPAILGYNHPVVNQAVSSQLEKGISFSLPHTLEVELAEELVRLIPCAEMVRFGKNGSDASTAAVRLARAFTGRDQIIMCGYHGWHDWYIGTTSMSRGVPKAVKELSHIMPYNDLRIVEGLLKEHGNNIAAIILEPTGVVPPLPGYLEGLRDLTRQYGVLLIFDEIITGFRMRLGGAQEFYKVTPDLSSFGKSMGNGMPIAAVVGKREFMELFNDIFFSTTFGGETLSLAASLATIRYMEEEDVIGTLWKRGALLMEGIKQYIDDYKLQDVALVEGYPVRSILKFREEAEIDPWVLKSFFQQECAARGLLFNGAHNMSFAHTEGIIEQTLQIYSEVFRLMAEIFQKGDNLRTKLRGRVVQPVFRKA